MLNIYRASAGAGKTFALTLEYFKVIFANPYEYKNILAVTFTNKATEEMKSRILKELNKLAQGESSVYRELLSNQLGMDIQQLQERAQLLQSLLLHDYGKIAITTIDAFFQRIVKSFARELGIVAGYNIELDSNFVLDKAIDRVMERVRKDRTLRSWIDELISTSIEEGSSWSVHGKLLSLGKELFNESYKLLDAGLLEKFSNKEFLADYHRFIMGVIKAYEEELQGIGKEAVRIITDHSLEVSDFAYGRSGAVNYFYKLAAGNFDPPGSRAQQAADSDKGWYTAKADRKGDIQQLLPRLAPLMARGVEIYNNRYEHYASALAVKKNIYLLGILNDLYSEVRHYCDENGVLLLSDTTQILNSLMEDNETSFIFEKFGNHFKHLMIDEFQDTSTMQWKNFKPLLENSVAQDATTLLVGDVKQSIYRWRNSDWMLLAHDVEQEFAHLGTNNIFLTNNWRSSHEVVTFNNCFFEVSSRLMAAQYRTECPDATQWGEAITGVYGDVEQEPKRELQGYVDVRFMEGDDDASEAEYVMNEVISIVEDIEQRGGEQRNIAVLVRTAKEGASIADGFMQYNMDHPDHPIHFISNDSLYLWSSLYIKFIVGVLVYLVRPDDKINSASISYYFSRYIKRSEESSDTILKASSDPGKGNLYKELNEQFKAFNTLSLYELVERIIEHLKLNDNKLEIPYLVAFQDVVYNYESCNPNNVTQFLEWWENEKGKQVLSTSEQVNAVRILTIHKSKGLEYDHVIVPFCSWKMDSLNPPRRIWCLNREEGFDALEYVPLGYSSKLANSLYKNSYYEEHLKAYVDNINLLYVALTRAKNELYLRPYKPKKDTTGKVDAVNGLLYETIRIFKESEETELRQMTIDDEMNLTYGIKQIPTKEVGTQEVLLLDSYPVSDSENRLSIRYRYKDYDNPKENGQGAIDEGKVLHMLFKSICYKEDVEMAVRLGVVQGVIAYDKREEFCGKMLEYMQQQGVEEWFSDRYRIINERDIIFPGGERIRPDRVMINANREVTVLDYKFGIRQSKQYEKQVAYYCKTLRQLGYNQVKGVIWYPKLKKQVIV